MHISPKTLKFIHPAFAISEEEIKDALYELRLRLQVRGVQSTELQSMVFNSENALTEEKLSGYLLELGLDSDDSNKLSKFVFQDASTTNSNLMTTGKVSHILSENLGNYSVYSSTEQEKLYEEIIDFLGERLIKFKNTIQVSDKYQSGYISYNEFKHIKDFYNFSDKLFDFMIYQMFYVSGNLLRLPY
jgi:hypothetical protein